jgi:hypothetical protein
MQKIIILFATVGLFISATTISHADDLNKNTELTINLEKMSYFQLPIKMYGAQ